MVVECITTNEMVCSRGTLFIDFPELVHTPRDVNRGVLLCLWWIEIQNKDDDKISTILLRMRNIGAMFDTLRPGEEKPKDSLQCVNVINGGHVEEEVDEMKSNHKT